MDTTNKLVVGGRYNWKGQPERLVYIGRNWSGNGYWHQFELVGRPGVVWCEVVDADLGKFEESKPADAAQATQAVSEPVATQPAEAVAWCELTPSGKIAYFDGKPMFMPGPVGNDCHRTPLYTYPAPASASEPAKRCADCMTPRGCALDGACGHELYGRRVASANVAGAGEVLAELVALKDMKDRFASMNYSEADPASFDAARADYARREPLAWAAARAALAARPVSDGEVDSLPPFSEFIRLVRWLDAKYARHKEIEDYEASKMLHTLWRAALARQAPAPLSQAVPEGSLASIERLALPAKECPPDSRVICVSWVDRLLSRHPQPQPDRDDGATIDSRWYITRQPQAVTEDARDGEQKS